MPKILHLVNDFVWGFPALILIIAVGLLLSIRTGWAQLRLFPAAIRAFFTSFSDKHNGNSPYRALCTALSATVGTGNISKVTIPVYSVTILLTPGKISGNIYACFF